MIPERTDPGWGRQGGASPSNVGDAPDAGLCGAGRGAECLTAPFWQPHLSAPKPPARQVLRRVCGAVDPAVPELRHQAFTHREVLSRVCTPGGGPGRADSLRFPRVLYPFADLKGSMEVLADRDPEEARKILDPVLEPMMEAVHRYEGTANQVMGDGIMALFGAPLAHEDHAVRACHAALRMQESVKRYAEEARRAHGVNVRFASDSTRVRPRWRRRGPGAALTCAPPASLSITGTAGRRGSGCRRRRGGCPSRRGERGACCDGRPGCGRPASGSSSRARARAARRPARSGRGPRAA